MKAVSRAYVGDEEDFVFPAEIINMGKKHLIIPKAQQSVQILFQNPREKIPVRPKAGNRQIPDRKPRLCLPSLRF